MFSILKILYLRKFTTMWWSLDSTVFNLLSLRILHHCQWHCLQCHLGEMCPPLALAQGDLQEHSDRAPVLRMLGCGSQCVRVPLVSVLLLFISPAAWHTVSHATQWPPAKGLNQVGLEKAGRRLSGQPRKGRSLHVWTQGTKRSFVRGKWTEKRVWLCRIRIFLFRLSGVPIALRMTAYSELGWQ